MVGRDKQSFAVGIAIASFVGSILIMFEDFGGYYYRDGYNHIDVYGYIYLGSGFLASVLTLAALAGLLVSLYFAIRVIRSKMPSRTHLVQLSEKAKLGGAITAGIAMLGALVFGIQSTFEGIDWWLDSAFYGAFIGGAIVWFLAKNMKK